MDDLIKYLYLMGFKKVYSDTIRITFRKFKNQKNFIYLELRLKYMKHKIFIDIVNEDYPERYSFDEFTDSNIEEIKNKFNNMDEFKYIIRKNRINKILYG